MKKSTKKVLIWSGSILGLILIVISIYLAIGIKQQVIGSQCPNSWDITSYDINAKTLTISLSGGANNANCYGSNLVGNAGISAIKNKEDCEFYLFTWLNEPTSEGNNCILTNNEWFKDKTYISDFICNHQCTYQNGRCSFGDSLSSKTNIGFDGFVVGFGDQRIDQRSDDSVSCSGKLTITSTRQIIKEEPISTQPISTPIVETQPEPEITEPIPTQPATEQTTQPVTSTQPTGTSEQTDINQSSTQGEEQNILQKESISGVKNLYLIISIVSIVVIFVVIFSVLIIKSKKKRR